MKATVLFALLAALGAAPALAAEPASMRGRVVGVDLAPVPGATIEILRDGAAVCSSRSGADGSFAFPCAAVGPHNIRARLAGRRSQQTEPFPLAPGRTFELNFVLVPDVVERPPVAEDGNWLTAPLPNPVVGTAGGRSFTLRALGIAVGVVAVALVLLNLLVLGPRFGWNKRRLSGQEVGELVLNEPLQGLADRVQPAVVVGAVGAEWSLVFGADEVKTMLAARQYGLLMLTLASPVLVGVAMLGLLTALLVGQERWLFLAMLLVPAGFFLVPVIVFLQARRRL